MGTAEQTEHSLSWLGKENVVEAVEEGLSFMVSYLNRIGGLRLFKMLVDYLILPGLQMAKWRY